MKISFKKNPKDLRAQYPIFSGITFAIIANEMQTAPDTVFKEKKLDFDKFYNYLQTKGFKKSFKDMKNLILEAAPILGITSILKLSKEEKVELKFQEKYIYGEESLDFFIEAEILSENAESKDIAVRSMDGETETAYYRFDKQLTEHERNMIRVAYSYKYGIPEKTPWKNYLDARPATLGHIEKNGKDLTCTRIPGDYREESYK